MKRLISLFLCFVLITGVLSGCGQSKGNDRSNGSGIKVMLTLSQADTFRNILVEAAQKAAKENGVQLDVKQAESSLENQVKQVKDAVKEKYDVILSPAAPTTAPKIGDSLSDPLKMYLGDIYTISVNLAGLPGMTVPCGTDKNGLPIGLQLIADCFNEKKMIQTAYTYEQAKEAE